MTTSELPVFHTERLTLRALTCDDTDALMRRYSEVENSEYMMFGPLSDRESAAKIVEFAESLVSEEEGVLWGVIEKNTGQLIGVLDYQHESAYSEVLYRSEIGYDLSPAHWGKGLMVEAIRPTLRYVFENSEVRRIHTGVDVNNYRSIRVLMKLGFQFEGILREYGRRRGQLYDEAMFSLLKRESLAK